MALIGSMISGVSSMQSFVKGMEIIGDNIANSKTVGFKRQRASFTESFSQTLQDALPSSGGSSNLPPIQVGAGVNLGATQKIFGQGSIESTGISSDLAISGDGFFRVFDLANQTSYLTRDGSFRVNEEGFFTDKNGNFLLGATGGTALEDPSTLGRLQLALDSPGVRVDLDNPERPIDELGRIVLADGSRALESATSSTGLYRVDSEGRLLDNTSSTIDFRDVQGVILNDVGGTAARAVLHDDGKYYLADENGAYIQADGTAVAPAASVNPAALTAAAGAVEWDPLVQVFSAIGDGTGEVLDARYDVTVPTAADIAVAAPNSADPNQFTLAIQNWTIGTDGNLRLYLNDGSSFVKGNVMLQNVQDSDALVEVGSGLYSGFENAGTIGLDEWNLGRVLTEAELSNHLPNQNGIGFIQARALEGSNTDLTQEFATMITTQRAFQAGSKVINVSDEMLQEIINLKR